MYIFRGKDKKLNKLKIVFFLIIFFVFSLITFSCIRESSGLKDGYYTAEEAYYNASGWKEYLTICISGGRIILAEYNAYNPSGFIKSWDLDYKRSMEAFSGTYPNAYYRYYSRLLLERQNAENIDALSGASQSHQIFVVLAEAVLKNAKEGNKETTLVSAWGIQ